MKDRSPWLREVAVQIKDAENCAYPHANEEKRGWRSESGSKKIRSNLYKPFIPWYKKGLNRNPAPNFLSNILWKTSVKLRAGCIEIYRQLVNGSLS